MLGLKSERNDRTSRTKKDDYERNLDSGKGDRLYLEPGQAIC